MNLEEPMMVGGTGDVAEVVSLPVWWARVEDVGAEIYVDTIGARWRCGAKAFIVS